MTAARAHGALQEDEAQRYGAGREAFIDFSANLNPFGPPACALDAAQRSDLSRYPDPDCRQLRRSLAAKLGVSERELLIGNGSSELFYLLARAFVAAADCALVFEPAFGEYRTALAASRATIVDVRASAENGFVWDVEAAAREIKERRHALAFLGCPNNPTGTYMKRDEVRTIAAALSPGLLVVDEAYVSFVGERWRSQRLAPNVAVVRSLTKDFALPGLRFGYMMASRQIVERTAMQQPSWSVSAPAQASALACLDEDAWLERTLAEVRSAKEQLVTALSEAGFGVHTGAANFVLVRVGDAAGVRKRLLERRLAVRDCTSFGLPQYIRVGVRVPEEGAILVQSLVEVSE